MIDGAHIIIYSKNPEADMIFFRDQLKLHYVDAGENWLIFALPPAEIAFHPHEKNNVHEIFLTCNNIEEFVREMKKAGIKSTAIQQQGWGSISYISLPGGGELGIYEPRHARPASGKQKIFKKK